MAHIFIGEYVFGSILKRYHLCPWDYSGHKHHLNGLICLDFVPVWFITGLLFEKILNKKKNSHNDKTHHGHS